MTNQIRVALLLGAVSIATSAQAGPKTLAECYDLVIAHCNTTAHPIPCAEAGMDDCDEVFDKNLVTPPRLGTRKFKAAD
jgi:hypothetical protein